jgi:Mg-chelatase subunit ChlD
LSHDEGQESGLARLYRSWEILDLLDETVAQLPAQWLLIMNIARHLLDGMPIPGITLPDELTNLVTRDGEVAYERRKVVVKRTNPRPPLMDEPQVRPIESIAEFPRILVNHRMWQFIDADLFLYKVFTHDVLIKEKDQSDGSLDEDEEVIEEFVKVVKPRRKRRQRVLLLRDTSSSMNDNNKGIFAKAVALAYLIKAREEGAEVSDRSFANRVHPRLRARADEEFAPIARRILKEGYYGTTDLASALEVTMAEIRREEVGYDANARAKTEILLISDCENPVMLPPLPPGVTINTLHLEGGREGLMLADYQDRLREIQDISSLFVRIDTSALQLSDAIREAWTVFEEEAAVVQELSAQRTPADVEADPTLRERVRRVQRLSAIYERMADQSKEHREFRALRAQFKKGHLGTERQDWSFLAALWSFVQQMFGRTPVAAHSSHQPHTPEHHLAAAMGHIEFRRKG